MRGKPWLALAAVALAVAAVAAGSWWWQSRPGGIHPGFAEAFVDLGRRGDDGATAVAYAPRMKVLAVGRDSGRLELWDATRAGARIVRQAHAVRIDHLAFGPDDGILLTASAGSNMMGLDPEAVPKVWDARTGELLLALPGEWIGGPMVVAPVPGFYLLASDDELRIYDHARRKVVGAPLRVEGGVTALDADATSGLVAVGSGHGDLLLLELQAREGAAPGLKVVGRGATHDGTRARTDVLAVLLRDGGRRLVSVHLLPEEQRAAQSPALPGRQSEVVEWNTSGWSRERVFPLSLQTVRWASHTPGEPWLVLSGTESTRGRIELLDLEAGVAWRYRANTSHPEAVLLPEARTGLVLQAGGATRIRYRDQD